MWLVAFSGIVLIIIITIIAVGKSMEKPKVAPNENKKCAPPQPCKLCTGMP